MAFVIVEFKAAGATIFGIGTALTGLSTAGIAAYFNALENKVRN
jgi:hypothetical protein